MIQKTIIFTLCFVAVVYGHGTSETSVSRPHEGSYKVGIDHHYHGHWSGAAYPHGYGGLGDGHGGYGLGKSYVIGALPQSLYGGHGYSGYGYGGHGYGHGYGLGYAHGHGYGHGYGHEATSYANYNQHAYGGHYGHYY